MHLILIKSKGQYRSLKSIWLRRVLKASNLMKSCVKKYYHSQFLTIKYKIKIGFNAVRARSGGAHAHIVGLLQAVNPIKFGIDEVHIWGNPDLLAKIPRLSWVHKHCPVCSQGSILRQLAWEKFEFPRILNELHILSLIHI